MNISFRLIAVLIFFTSFVSACGGNPPWEKDPVVETEKIHGLWTGSDASGKNSVLLALLENGQTWAVYGPSGKAPTPLANETLPSNIWNGLGTLEGFISASIKGVDGKLEASTFRDFSYYGTAIDLKLSGNYQLADNAKKIPTSNLTLILNSTILTLVPVSETNYQYRTTASLSDAVGIWTGLTLGKTATSITITPDMVITTLDGGCLRSGRVIPRNPSISGVNVFEATLRTDTGCGDFPSTYEGVIIVTKDQTKRRLHLLTVSPNREKPFVLIAESSGS